MVAASGGHPAYVCLGPVTRRGSAVADLQGGCLPAGQLPVRRADLGAGVGCSFRVKDCAFPREELAGRACALEELRREDDRGVLLDGDLGQDLQVPQLQGDRACSR